MEILMSWLHFGLARLDDIWDVFRELDNRRHDLSYSAGLVFGYPFISILQSTPVAAILFPCRIE